MIRINISKKLLLPTRKHELRIDTKINTQSLTAIYGPSGAGKTSLLKIIAGLLTPEKGIIEVNGETWFDSEKKINLPPQKRKIGFVFQDYALFPNMRVKENLLYALTDKKDIALVDRLLDVTELGNIVDRKPQHLSGGQQQRVALARALVRKPDLLLLDEPLSALDRDMRSILQQEIKQLHREFKLTTVMVSHDVAEVYKLADHVIQLNEGSIVNSGTPTEVFDLGSGDNKIIIIGEVLSLVQYEDHYHVEVLAEQRILKLSIPVDAAKNLRPNVKISLTYDATSGLIQKVS